MTKDPQKLFLEFLDECKYSARLRPETIRGYSEVFKLFLKVMPEVTRLESFTPENLNEFFKRIQTRQRLVGKDTVKTGVKNSTIKTQRSKLNVFFNWLCKKNHIMENPLKEIRPPSVTYDDYRRVSDEDLDKIRSAIVRTSSSSLVLRRDTAMISLLVSTGMRKSEFVSLKVTDVDFDKKEITIRGETSKSKKTRVLKMHDTLIFHLKDYMKERNSYGLKTASLIVSTRGDRGLSSHGLEHWVKRLIKKSGVNFHLHCFRHTFGCKLAEKDINIFKIQKMMGHTNIQMTMKYARSLRTEEMGADIAKISI